MSDAAAKQAALDRIAACVGPEAYNRLVEAAPDTRKKGRLRFWQEQLFKRVAGEAGLTIATLDDYVGLFADAPPLHIELPPLTKAQFLADPNRLWYAARRHEIEPEWFKEGWRTLQAFRDNLTYELTRDVRKTGSLRFTPDLLAYLPKILDREQVVAVYVSIRDESGRPEDEWRTEFEEAFPEHAAALPRPLRGRPPGEA
jgi:hypothetical protein